MAWPASRVHFFLSHQHTMFHLPAHLLCGLFLLLKKNLLCSSSWTELYISSCHFISDFGVFFAFQSVDLPLSRNRICQYSETSAALYTVGAAKEEKCRSWNGGWGQNSELISRGRKGDVKTMITPLTSFVPGLGWEKNSSGLQGESTHHICSKRYPVV